MASRRDRGAAAGCMKFLIDMNLSPLWVSFLANFGFAAVHWSTVGHASAPDTEIMEFAVANGYIVFTHDLDFGMLLAAQRRTGPSVIQVRSQHVLPSAIGEVVLRAIGRLNLTWKRAPSLPWILPAIAFDCCRSDLRLCCTGPTPARGQPQSAPRRPLHYPSGSARAPSNSSSRCLSGTPPP